MNNVKSELLILQGKVENQECEVTDPKHKQSNIVTRLPAQERYSSRKCVLVWNPPFDARAITDVTDAKIQFFKTSLRVNIRRGRIKGFHMYMGNYGTNMPTIICRFAYLDNKHAMYKAKTNLKYQKIIETSVTYTLPNTFLNKRQ